MTYIRRLSYLMTMGAPTASVALYLPTSSLWLHDAVADTQFVSTERLLSEHQIDFDIVSEDALADPGALALRSGTFQTLSGNAYRTVILPSPSLLSHAAVDRLRAFAAAGGRVVFLGHTPSLIAGHTILNASPATSADFSWATVIPADLPHTPTPGDQPPTQPPAPQNISAPVLDAVLAAIPAPDITLDQPDPAFKMMKRRWKDADLYLLFNEGPQPSTHTITLSGPAKTVSAWDPQTGATKPLDAKPSAEGLKLNLSLSPYATTVLIARH